MSFHPFQIMSVHYAVRVINDNLKMLDHSAFSMLGKFGQVMLPDQSEIRDLD